MNHSAQGPLGTTMKERLQPADLGFGPLFWAARDAVIVCDGDTGRVVFCNPAVKDVYGYDPEELVDQPFDIFATDRDKEDVRQMAENFYAAMDEGRAVQEATVEYPARHKSGRELWVEFNVSPLHIPGRNISFVLIRDCTERKRIEMERDALLADVQETLRQANALAKLKMEFTAMITHEVGSPIAAVAAMVDLLERDDLPADKRAQIFSTIRLEIHLLQRLIEDSQSAASINSGNFAVRLEPISVHELLSEAITSAQSHLSGHDLRLESTTNVLVMADPERISQVLRNLLANAAKYTPAGTPVTLRSWHENGRVHIDVIDEGPGIPAADLEHIFTKFGRGRDESGKRRPGMGLGLFLSRRIVQEHGSTLFATSELGKGTTFSFDLLEAPA